MKVDNTNQTTSYGHVLARRIKAAVARIPESRRGALLDEIRCRVAAGDLGGPSHDPTILAYVVKLLASEKPQEPLGRKRSTYLKRGAGA